MKTLDRLFYLCAAASIFMATAMTYGDGVHDFKMGGLCLLLILSCQFLVNTYLHTHKAGQRTFCRGRDYAIVFLLYGIVPLAGCYYLQSREMNLAVLISGMSCGAFAVRTYLTRDYILAVDLSATGCAATPFSGQPDRIMKYGYLYSLFIAGLVPVGLYLIMQDHLLILFCSFLLLPAGPMIKKFFSPSPAQTTGMVIFHIGWIIAYCCIFALGWVF